MANFLRSRRSFSRKEPAADRTKLERISYTLHWDDIPHWNRDNEFIRNGYRRVQNNWRGCIYSVFGYLHNETVNIHSHLFGAILFVYLLVTAATTYLKHYPTTWIDHLMFAIFLASAIFCLFGSALFHTTTCHSAEVAAAMQRVDYAGIVILTVGSFYPCLYYGFYCEPVLQIMYIGGITLVGFVAAYVVLSPEYGKPTHRTARTSVFIALGLCAIFPTCHWVWKHGLRKLFGEMGFEWLLLSGALYIGGALLYANRIPERLSPGRFDLFFSSHQIFHFCVVAAALAHLMSIGKALDHSYSTKHPCAP